VIGPFFWSVFAIAITLQLSHNDGVAHRRWEMPQHYLIPVVQQAMFLANPCAEIKAPLTITWSFLARACKTCRKCR
jgi:hypothetical protein